MSRFYIFAAATVMSVACGAWAGVTPVAVAVSPVQVDVEADTRFVSVYPQVDHADLFVETPEISTTKGMTESVPRNQGRRQMSPTVVSLPSAAPAGFMMFGLLGFVSLVRRMRNRNRVTRIA